MFAKFATLILVVAQHAYSDSGCTHGCPQRGVGTQMLQMKGVTAKTGERMVSELTEQEQLASSIRKMVMQDQTPCKEGEYNVTINLGDTEISEEQEEKMVRRLESLNRTCSVPGAATDQPVTSEDANSLTEEVFDASDHDHNGYLDPPEFWHFLHGDNDVEDHGNQVQIQSDDGEALDKRINKMMYAFDTDLNGGISKDEFLSGVFDAPVPALVEVRGTQSRANCAVGQPTGETQEIDSVCVTWKTNSVCFPTVSCSWQRRRRWSGKLTCDERQTCNNVPAPSFTACKKTVDIITDPMSCFVEAIKSKSYVVRDDCDFSRGMSSPEANGLATPCMSPEKMSANLNTIDYRQTKYTPVDFAEKIINHMTSVGGTFYNDPGHKYTLEQTDNVLSLVDEMSEGYFQVVPHQGVNGFFDEEGGGYNSKKIYTKAGFKDAMGDLRIRNKWKAASAGLEVLGSFCGPAAIGFSIATAYIDYKDSIDAQAAQYEFAQKMYESIMEEVGGMINQAQEANKAARERHSAVAFAAQAAVLKTAVQSAHQAMKIDIQMIEVINNAKEGNNDEVAWLILDSFQDDMLHSRPDWLRSGVAEDYQCAFDQFSCSDSSWDRWGNSGDVVWEYDGERHYRPKYKATRPAGWGGYAQSSCAMYRNNLIYSIAPMMAWTLSVADTKVRMAKRAFASDSLPTMHKVELERLFGEAQHYRNFLDKFELSACVGVSQPCNKNGKIIICSPPNVDYTKEMVRECTSYGGGGGYSGGYGYGGYGGYGGGGETCYDVGYQTYGRFAYNSGPTTSKVWELVTRMKSALDGLLATKPALLQSSEKRVNEAAEMKAWSEFAANRPHMRAYLDICGGVPCKGPKTPEQNRALRAHLDKHWATMREKLNL